MPDITFTTPRLCHYNYDVSKAWFVYFEVTNVATGESVRKQFRAGINHWHDKANRLKDGNVLVKIWKDKLTRGDHNFFMEAGVSTTDLPKNVEDAVSRVMAIKKATLKKKSVTGYTEISNRFTTWCKTKRYHILPLYHFTANMARGYLDYLILDRKNGGKTHNNHLNVMRAFFSVMLEKWPTMIKSNPFKGIKMMPVSTGGNLAYTEKEKKILIAWFKANDIRTYYAIQFIFHCFIRKTELTHLKVGDIDWVNGTITINSEAAKNRVQDSVTIPEGLFPVLREMGLETAPKHFYIFGYEMQTCERRINKADNISEAHLKGKTAAGLPADDGKAFYSWKHSGVIAYWSIIKDPYFMQRQLRHSDLATTMIYMKSLGLMANIAFVNAKIVL